MSTQTNARNSTKKIGLVGLAAIVASIVANLIVLFAAKALLDLPAEFAPLQAGAIVTFTFIGTFLAMVAFWIISRVAKNPIRTYQIVAVVALILSIIPNIGLMFNPGMMPMPGDSATPLAAGVLIVFHFVAAGICIWLFSTRTQEA